jgi:hydroxymethylglutaryl-CoA lyase
MKWVNKLSRLGITIFSIADTAGIATPATINYLFGHLRPAYPALEFGAHLHATPETCVAKVEAAYLAGIRRFDCAISGFGGCPFTGSNLVGNVPTDRLVSFLEKKNSPIKLNQQTIEQLELSFQKLIAS